MKTWDEAYDAATTEQRKSVRKWRKGVKWRNGLSGDRNQCPTCGEFFNSTYAFDSHRYGKISDRKCMTRAEMIKHKFSRNDDFYWVTENTRDKRSQESILTTAIDAK